MEDRSRKGDSISTVLISLLVGWWFFILGHELWYLFN